MTDIDTSPEAVERALARSDKWDRCWPGNVHIEGMVDELTALLRQLAKKKAELEARVKELEAEIAFRPPKAKYPPFSSTP